MLVAQSLREKLSDSPMNELFGTNAAELDASALFVSVVEQRVYSLHREFTVEGTFSSFTLVILF